MREPTVHRTVRVVYLSDDQSRTEPIVEIPADQWDALSARLQAAERLAEAVAEFLEIKSEVMAPMEGDRAYHAIRLDVPGQNKLEAMRTHLAAYRAAGTEP